MTTLPSRRLVLRPVRLAALAALVCLAAPLSAGESRTLTAKDGRAIEGEIVGYKGETLRVLRADTGREVRIPVSALTEADQQSTRRFIRDNPGLRDAVQPGDIRVEFSRAKFEREKTSDTYWRDENAESWGFSISILNQTSLPIEGLRVDYVLYALEDPDNVYTASRTKTRSENLQRIRGTESLAAIPSGQRASLRTSPVVSTRVKYTDGVRMITADGKRVSSWRDKALHGVWFRVYDGDKLVHEASSPDGLRSSERWTD